MTILMRNQAFIRSAHGAVLLSEFPDGIVEYEGEPDQCVNKTDGGKLFIAG